MPSMWDYYPPACIEFVEDMIKKNGKFNGFTSLEEYRKNFEKNGFEMHHSSYWDDDLK